MSFYNFPWASSVIIYEIWLKEGRTCFTTPLNLNTLLRLPANEAWLLTSWIRSFIPLYSSLHPVCWTKSKYCFKLTLSKCYDNFDLSFTAPMKINKHLFWMGIISEWFISYSESFLYCTDFKLLLWQPSKSVSRIKENTVILKITSCKQSLAQPRQIAK